MAMRAMCWDAGCSATKGSGDLITRRGFLRASLGAIVSGLAVGAYAFGVEPFRMRRTDYRLALPGWVGPNMTIAIIADPHMCEPYMTAARLRGVVDRVNDMSPDLTLLLGDYVATHRFVRGVVPARDWAAEFARLKAPLGVHAVMGNHDWWDDPAAQARRAGPTYGEVALRDAGIEVYENRAVKLGFQGQDFWLAGLGDQIGLNTNGRWSGVDDLPGTLAQITDDAPVILMAHEPDIFPKVPARVALTLSGHTHGGQLRMFGYSPKVPSAYANRYAYGLVEEADPEGMNRKLLVSGGLGCSILPFRFGVPPEILHVTVGA